MKLFLTIGITVTNPQEKGSEGAKQDYRGATSVFSNTHYTIDELIATESRVIVR